MKKEQLKSRFDLFDYLMYGYSYVLEEVKTKNGKQRRLKDEELEKNLKEKTKEFDKQSATKDKYGPYCHALYSQLEGRSLRTNSWLGAKLL